MAYRRCCAKTCYNTQVSRPVLKFFTFPKNQQIAHQWASNAGRNDLLLKTPAQLCKYFLCAEHFTKDCFANPPHCTILRRNSFPIFIPVPTEFKSNLDNYTAKYKDSINAPNESGNKTLKNVEYKLVNLLSQDERDNGTLEQESLTNVIEKEINVLSNKISDDEDNVTFNSEDPQKIHNKLCRLCANLIPVEQLIHIFDNEESKSIFDKLSVVLLHQISEDDEFPKDLCFSCKSNLDLSVNIIEGFRMADAKLKDMNVKNEIVNELVLVENEINASEYSKFYTYDNVSNVYEEGEESTELSCNESKEGIYYNLDEKNILSECAKPIELFQNQESCETQQNAEIKFICKYCGISFKLLSLLQIHTNKFHENNLSCTICKEIFLSSASLKKHILIHSERNILCSICGKFLADNQTYKKHLFIIHSNLKPYKCLVCQKTFKTKRNMKLHLESHERSKKYQCAVCSKKFHLRSLLTQHILIHSSFKKHVCTLCGARFNRLGNLKQHSKIHRNINSDENGFQCKICKRVLKSELLFKSHMIKHTGERKSFLCEFCDKKFYNSEQWAVHNRLHTGVRPFACESCGQTFRGIATLRQHSLLHSDIYPHSCHYCERKFKRLQSLNVHLKTHTGEKPFCCPTCSRAFAQKGDMLKHTKIHNKSKFSMNSID